MNTINDLLESGSAHVQGHHTRLIKNSDGGFSVLRRIKVISPDSAYQVNFYFGYSEEEAVKAFIEAEKSK